ncbi:MAG: carboxypeptidase regulatory-like domain-containing protein [Fibrobacteria bacterium]
MLETLPLRGSLLSGMIAFSMAGCLFESDKPGRGHPATEGTHVAGLRGTLVDTTGRLMAGARVAALPVGGFRLPSPGMPDAAMETTFTDPSGRYAFRGLDSGTYNLIGGQEAQGLVALVPQVAFAGPGQALDVGVDTMRVSEGIRGRVTGSGAGEEGVIAYIPGTSYFAVSDANGDFLLTGIPQGYGGRYRRQVPRRSVDVALSGRARPDSGT